MKVLVITGDKKFGSGHERYELQRSAVDELAVVYWGRGSLWPKIPAGKFDVVTAQDPFWRGLFGMWAAKRTKAKLNVQVHTDLSAYGVIKQVLMQIVLRHADSVRVVSNNIKSQVEKIDVRAKISVLPVFVDISKYQNVARREHTGKNIVWIGRFEEEKNPLQAIEVFKQVLKTEPAAKLSMLGNGSLSRQVAAAAIGLPVELPGWQDPVQFLDTADVVLCTSVHESWGASIIEALAAGVPVVAPDVGVAREAGACIASRTELALKVEEVLRKNMRGKLKLHLLSADEWAMEWKKTL
ncbi:MAG TPA: glycosyltransferase [Candidatus Paceibacterota bacterium]